MYRKVVGFALFFSLLTTCHTAASRSDTSAQGLTPEEMSIPYGGPDNTNKQAMSLDFSDDPSLLNTSKLCVEVPQQLPNLDPGTKRSIRTCTNNITGTVTVTAITEPCYQVEVDHSSYLTPTGKWYLSIFTSPLYTVAERQAAIINQAQPAAGAAVRKINHCEHVIIGNTSNLLRLQLAEDLLNPDPPSI